MKPEETAKTDGEFEIKQVTKFEDIASGKVKILPESDLCFQNENTIVQFKYKKPDEEKKFEIQPGIYTLTDTPAGVRPAKTEFRDKPLLDVVDSTQRIIGEARVFFNRLEVYEKRGRPKLRSVLLASKPGMGKTSAISKICREFLKEDAGTVVFNWPTSEVEPEKVSNCLSANSEYSKECTRLLLIIEDIGGGERDSEYGKPAVSSGLLNLLDGVNVTFKLPTFIIATTNHPENLMEALADRPGRFDLVEELNHPVLAEKIALMEFFAQRLLTPEEKSALGQKEAEEFSIAHLEEVIIRSELHDKTVQQVIKELVEHKKKFKRGFEKERQGLGLGGR